MAANNPSYALTEKALEKLLTADEFTDDPILLQIHHLSDNDGYLAVDGSGKAVRVKLLDQLLRSESYHIVFVRGVVVSTVNAGLSEPLLTITTYNVVEERDEPLMQPPATMFKIPADKTLGGMAYDFFSRTCHFLSNADLSGFRSEATTMTVDWKEKESIVSHFLEHDKAIKTISRSSAQSSAFNDTATIGKSDYYMSAQNDFMASQLDRQKASLTSNTGREDAETSVKIAQQHALCLNRALEQDIHADLTPELLCAWHGILCGDGLHRHAGVLRPRGVHVRVGQMSFRPSAQVVEDIAALCRSLVTLEARLLRNGNSTSPRALQTQDVISPGMAAVTFAAAVFFGVVDTHAFADGNGRLARIAANWALRRAGVPFCIHFFATPAQRKEYREATIATRRNLYLVSKGHVSQETLLEAFRDGKCLRPLVELFMDRLAKAVTEFGNLVKEKNTLITDQDEARAARMFRERAATGNCFICFEENPNIATLCCGKAVHLNCMAEWLSSKNSCPQCRGDLPSLSPRLRPPNPDEDDEETTEDSFETTDSTTSSMSDEGAADTTSDDTTSTTEEIVVAMQPAPVNVPIDDDTTTEDDDDTTMAGSGDAPMVDDTTSDDTDETQAAPPANAEAPIYCGFAHCHNRSARDCANGCCGRCFVLHGRFACPRHNVS